LVRAYTREEVLGRLEKTIQSKKPIVCAGASTGIIGVGLERGGCDLIIIFNSGRFRRAGLGSLAAFMPYGDANTTVMDLSREIIPMVKETPVIAAVCASDPFRVKTKLVKELQELGFSGTQNFPSVGVIDGVYRSLLEETGMGYDKEVEWIKTAHDMGMFTGPVFAFSVDEAERMVRAGADVLVAHMGLTTKGLVGPKTALTLPQAAKRTQDIVDKAKQINPDVILLSHGGPIAEIDDFKYILQNTKGLHGFVGATTFERLPIEKAIPETVREFKAATLS
jgi:predicted TIM-barrel enzyme